MPRIYAAAAIALLAGTSAQAATVITNDRLPGKAYELDPSEFKSLSTVFEPRGSVTTSLGIKADGRHAILKSLDLDAIPDGRFNPDGDDIPWIDSADIGLLRWDVEFKTPVKAFGFGVTDAADTPQKLFPVPFWRLAVDGVTANAERRFNDEGEPVTWYSVIFDKPTRSASLTMLTAPGDGYGIVSATVAPVPLPAAAWLMLASLGSLLGMSKWRRRLTS